MIHSSPPHFPPPPLFSLSHPHHFPTLTLSPHCCCASSTSPTEPLSCRLPVSMVTRCNLSPASLSPRRASLAPVTFKHVCPLSHKWQPDPLGSCALSLMHIHTHTDTHSLIIRILCFISMTKISAVMAVQRLHKVGKIFSSDVEWVLIQFSTVNLTLYAVAEKLFFPSLSTVNTAWRYIPGEQRVQLNPEAVAILSSFSVSPDLVIYSPKQTVLTTFFSRCPLNEVLLLFPWLYFPHSRLCEGCALEPAVWVDISPSYHGFNYYL